VVLQAAKTMVKIIRSRIGILIQFILLDIR
jgi:hypothetical protein